jgi:hypothetical protein
MVTWFRCGSFRDFHAFDGSMNSHKTLSLCGKVPFSLPNSFRDCILDFDKACKKCLEVIASRAPTKLKKGRPKQ